MSFLSHFTRPREARRDKTVQLTARFTCRYELRPSDILIERFQAWKRLVKNLIAYFEGIADIEVSARSGRGKGARRLGELTRRFRRPTRQRSSPSSVE